MLSQRKIVLIAGLPLYLALFVVAGVYTKHWPLPGAIEEIAEGIWQSLFIISIVTPKPLVSVGEKFSVLSCTEGWCIPTASGLLAFSLIFSLLIYFALVRFSRERKGAVSSDTAPKN